MGFCIFFLCQVFFFLNKISGMLFFPNANSESVSGFVAEQNLTKLLNLRYTVYTVYCINGNKGVTGEQIKNMVCSKVFSK